MKKTFLFGIAISASILMSSVGYGQAGMAVNTTGAAANSSAILDVSSTTQGMLVPRMTAAQRTAIGTPATGLLVYQTDGTAGFYFYTGSSWLSLNSTSSTAGGDLTGSYPNPTIAATAGAGNDAVAAINAGASTINAARLGSGSGTSTVFLNGNGAFTTPSGGTTLNNGTAAGQIYVTSTTPFAVNPTPVTVSGNGTLSSTGVFAVTSLPAISGANLTNITPSNLTSGGTLPFENGSNLTSLNASNLSSGTVAVARGGTGQITATAAFNALSPMTTAGDIMYYNAGSAQRLPIGGTNGQVLTVASGLPSWAAAGGGSPSFPIHNVGSASTCTVSSTDGYCMSTNASCVFTLPGAGTVSNGHTVLIMVVTTSSGNMDIKSATGTDTIWDSGAGVSCTGSAGIHSVNPSLFFEIMVSDGSSTWYSWGSN